ncbi:MAG: alanine--tRNA ligase-related protein, partial [Bacteriovoracaceae bacterium]
GEDYPQNADNQSLAENYLMLEEEKFRQTLSTGLELLNAKMKELKDSGKKTLSGDAAFKLYDTYGFPLDLTQTILEENEFAVDEEGFGKEMQKQKERSKQSSQFQAGEDNLKKFYEVKEKFGETEFLGYAHTKAEGKLLSHLEMDDIHYLVFDRTPFYGESGGQAGDKGEVMDSKGGPVAKVIDTQIPVEGLTVHICSEVALDKLRSDEEYELAIDCESRRLIMRNHSATHLLQAALINVLGDHIKQAGSLVSDERLRFDFTHHKALTKEEMAKVESLVNAQIQKGLEVGSELMSMKEAQKVGAMALFGEKYGDNVRVLKMGEFSLELCGGTHVANTSDIGLFVITSEASLSSGVRRMEALTSTKAVNFLKTRSDILAKIERKLASKGEAALEKIENLQNETKAKSKEIKSLQDKVQAQTSKDLFKDIKNLGKDFGLVLVDMEDANPKEFRKLSDKFVDQNKKDVLMLVSETDGKLNYLLRTHKDNAQINCSRVLK